MFNRPSIRLVCLKSDMPIFKGLGFARLRKPHTQHGKLLVLRDPDVDTIPTMLMLAVHDVPFLARISGFVGCPDSLLAFDGELLVTCEAVAGHDLPAIDLGEDRTLRGEEPARRYWTVRANFERSAKLDEEAA